MNFLKDKHFIIAQKYVYSFKFQDIHIVEFITHK